MRLVQTIQQHIEEYFIVGSLVLLIGYFGIVLQNGLAQLGATEPTKRLITGSVIIAAVLFDRWRLRKR